MRKLLPTKNDEANQIYSRLESEDGKIFMGFWPVLFGVRVRAGYVGLPHVEIDWCCGDNQIMQVVTYNILRDYIEDGGDIKNLPGYSKVKPWYNDKEFIDELALVIQTLWENEKINRKRAKGNTADNNKRSKTPPGP